MTRTLRFSRVPGSFAISRLAANAAVPEWALRGLFFSVTSTGEELSIVCPGAQVPFEIVHESGWASLKLPGPFPFSETGILASFVRPLSERAIPIFAVSTFDTDYVLVKEKWLEKSVQALLEAGHEEVAWQNPQKITSLRPNSTVSLNARREPFRGPFRPKTVSGGLNSRGCGLILKIESCRPASQYGNVA